MVTMRLYLKDGSDIAVTLSREGAMTMVQAWREAQPKTTLDYEEVEGDSLHVRASEVQVIRVEKY